MDITNDDSHPLEDNELLKENQKLKESLLSLQTENSIFQQKIFTLQHMCNDYTAQYKELVSENDFLKLRQQYAHEILPRISNCQDIQKLKHELQICNEEVIKKDKTIATFSHQIAEMKELLHYKEQEIQTITTIFQQDLLTKTSQINTINEKFTKLQNQNDALQKEKTDLLALIEEKNGNKHWPARMRQYSSSRTVKRFGTNSKSTLSMSKTHLLVHEIDQAYLSPSEFMSVSKSINNSPNLLEEKDMFKEFAKNKSTDIFEQKHISDGIFGNLQTFEQNKKDYLHFTAHVMIMKYPQVTHVTVVDLINKIDFEYDKFWEYYDIMDAMMKKETDGVAPKLHKQSAMSTASVVSINDDTILFEDVDVDEFENN